MPKPERNGNRKTREQLSKRRIPKLGYYFIVTDTKETEQNYMHGLRDSIPQELRGNLVIKVIKTKTKNLVEEALNLVKFGSSLIEIKCKALTTLYRKHYLRASMSDGQIRALKSGLVPISALCLHITIL